MPKSWTISVAMLAVAVAVDGMTVNVTPSSPSPASVGTVVSFSAASPDASAGTLWYRFRVRRPGGQYSMLRDFGPDNVLNWAATARDGVYDLEVTARNLANGDVASTMLPYWFKSLVVGSNPVVTPTSNSLVFLFSAPGCESGGRMRVEFAPGVLAAPDVTVGVGMTEGTQYTPFKACTPGVSMNFFLAGMLSNTQYSARALVDTGSGVAAGETVTFLTGKLPDGLYSDVILTPYAGISTDPVLLGSPIGKVPAAHDLAGNVIWYGVGNTGMLTRPIAGGDMWGLIELAGQDPSKQLLQRFDLTGMIVQSTNAARVNEQLHALGMRSITGFHHEARSIGDGRVVVLAGVEQVLTDVQAPGPVDVLGDMIVVLDKDLQVVWAWDTFDHLDVHRTAVLGETCPSACPPLQLSKVANDWTHGNAVEETPDGNLLYSTRHQDWLIKLNYDGGTGDGRILWKLGRDGDFAMNSRDPYPWFSHQHDGNLEPGNKLLVFDDGNTRVTQMGGGNSRGQVLQLDETKMTVTPILNADLGVYAAAVGSAQQLRDGHYHFDAGFVQENNTIDAYSYEVTRAGKTVYEAHQNVIEYRTFRMQDLYTPN